MQEKDNKKKNMPSENPDEKEGHSGKTNSSSAGEQLRGGDETYSNVSRQ